MRISRDYPLKTWISKQPIGKVTGYEIIPFHSLKYPRSKQGLTNLEQIYICSVPFRTGSQ
jgi:hypothetical protein